MSSGSARYHLSSSLVWRYSTLSFSFTPGASQPQQASIRVQPAPIRTQALVALEAVEVCLTMLGATTHPRIHWDRYRMIRQEDVARGESFTGSQRVVAALTAICSQFDWPSLGDDDDNQGCQSAPAESDERDRPVPVWGWWRDRAGDAARRLAHAARSCLSWRRTTSANPQGGSAP